MKLCVLVCSECGSYHREIPDYILPFKRYDGRIIFGVVSGVFSSDMLAFEDYPCEMTMKRWKKEYAKFTSSYMK